MCNAPAAFVRMRLCVTKAVTMDDGRGAGATYNYAVSSHAAVKSNTGLRALSLSLPPYVYNMCLIPFHSTDRLRRRIVNNWSEFNDTAWLNGVCTVALTAFNPGLIYYTATIRSPHVLCSHLGAWNMLAAGSTTCRLALWLISTTLCYD